LLRAALLEHLRANKVLCEEAASADELRDQLRLHEWDVLILDLRLPQHTKLQTVRTLHGRYPDLPILVISFATDIPTRSWQQAGASGFVSKAKLADELIEAMRLISEGWNYFPNAGPEERIT
jgi:DNA-binding NarL/FixJ family response regulator